MQIYQILSHFQMNSNCESQIFPRIHKEREAVSIAIFWENMTGTFDGEVKILISNDGIHFSTNDTISINTEENISDSLLIFLNIPFNFIKLQVKRNNIINGDISANIYYN